MVESNPGGTGGGGDDAGDFQDIIEGKCGNINVVVFSLLQDS